MENCISQMNLFSNEEENSDKPERIVSGMSTRTRVGISCVTKIKCESKIKGK